LRGLGACPGLAGIESLGSLKALASTGSAARQAGYNRHWRAMRTAFIFFPNGAIPSAWWPEEKEEFALSPTLEPFGTKPQLIQVLVYGPVCAIQVLNGPAIHGAGNGVFSRRPFEKERDGYSGRHFHRPGACRKDRPFDPFFQHWSCRRPCAKVVRLRLDTPAPSI